MPGFFDKAADVWAGEKADNAGLNAELERLSALDLRALGAEVMRRGFGPDGPGANTYVDMDVVGAAVSGPYQGRDYDAAADAALMAVVAEAIQVLEHACLVRPVFHGQGGDHSVHYAMAYTATRLGRSALEQNAVERVLAGGSL
jgi:hypothetical protein